MLTLNRKNTFLIFILVVISFLTFCTPKGPQTFDSIYIGRTEEYLIKQKGQANKIQHFENAKAYIYIKKEEYFGKNVKDLSSAKPKKVYEIEYIYYINNQNIIFKYQVWKKKVK